MYRRHARRIGAKFIEQGRLDAVEDIFNLTMKEISNAQNDKNMDLRSLIAFHLEPYEAVKHVKDWPLLIDSRGKILRENRSNDTGEPNVLLGDPIAPGKIQGKAKVLHFAYEKPLLSGEVLVARFTEPSWTPIFINASAVIMEVGGPLQHGAIIAREYGIPCISGLTNATSLIHDGVMLEVDGSSGTIRILRDNKND
jgi:rifampicin phosphotransferase